ncbi:MAG: hypothetical protein DRN53_03500 [Thermoprotei archaeon]|nr:MAG: hypothetical protein DRN53_03500 [Thermoprotei archaeon]
MNLEDRKSSPTYEKTYAYLPATIFTRIFNTTIPKSCKIHISLHDFIASQFNKLLIEGELDSEKEEAITKRYEHLIPILTVLRRVYSEGFKESSREIPKAIFDKLIDPPHLLYYESPGATSGSYELSIGDYAYDINSEQIIEIERKKHLVLEPYEPILVMTGQYLVISENISGSIRTRFTLHLRGIQHINHKIDPGFHGYIVFILNNLLKKRKVLIKSDERIADVKFELLPSDEVYYRYHKERHNLINELIREVEIYIENQLNDIKRCSLKNMYDEIIEKLEKLLGDKPELIEAIKVIASELKPYILLTRKPIWYISSETQKQNRYLQSNKDILRYLVEEQFILGTVPC